MTFSTTDFVFVNHRESCQLCVLTSAILHIESDQSLRKFSHQRRVLNFYPLIMLMRFLPCKSSNDMFDFLKCELCKEFDTPDKIDELANKMLVIKLKAHTRLRISAISPEPSVLANTKNGIRFRFMPHVIATHSLYDTALRMCLRYNFLMDLPKLV